MAVYATYFSGLYCTYIIIGVGVLNVFKDLDVKCSVINLHPRALYYSKLTATVLIFRELFRSLGTQG
jgi:hypothetical protein